MKSKIQFTILLALLITSLPSTVLGGASNASLQCKSTSSDQQIKLEGSIPGELATFELKLSRGKHKILMNEELKERIYVIQAFDKGVFTIAIGRNDGRDLFLYALPKSTNVRPVEDPHTARGSFRAVLQKAPKPGYKGPVNYDSMLHNISMICKYRYTI